MMKRKRVGTFTSVRLPSITALDRRMKPTMGVVSMGDSPTRMLDASAPAGIFLAKCSLYCKFTSSVN